MRKIMRWGTVPLLVLFAASCTDENSISGPETGSQIATVSSPSNVTAGETTTVDLLAGQDILVGEVNVTHNGNGTVSIEYVMDAGFCLDETHWEANYQIGNLVNGAGQPVPGEFAYGDDMLDCATTYTELDKDILGTDDGDYVVAAHAVVVGAEEGDNPNVVFGTFDADGDGADEGDIYGINPTTGDLTLVADIPNDATGDPFDPNGLAIDRSTEELFFVTELDLFKVPAENADPMSVTPTLVASGLSTGGAGEGTIRNATVDGDFYYYVPNDTDELWRVGTDGTGNALFCDLGATDGLFFGDIASDPADPGTIYGTARVGNGDTGNVLFFAVDLATCGASGATFIDPTTYDFQLQVAFGDDGTLYGQQALSEPSADNPGQWYILDKATGERTTTLAQTEISFTDIAGGLPFEPVEFDETAWADGDRFTQRGNWATFMGPFTIEE